MIDYESEFYEDADLAPEDLWGQYGFTPQEAQQWMAHGFDDPKEADEWHVAVGHPDTAARLADELNLLPTQARGWGAVIEQHDGDFPLLEAFTAVDGSATLAAVYARHFPVDEWVALNAAHVPARASAPVARLSEQIDARDYDRGLEKDRTRSIMEAALWLGDYQHLKSERLSLLSNLVYLNKTPTDVPLIVMDVGEDAVSDISPRQALHTNTLLLEAGYEADEQGLAAYRLIARLDAHPKHLAQLIKAFGMQRVVSALDTGLDTFPQLQHHLSNGGVAEMARGAL